MKLYIHNIKYDNVPEIDHGILIVYKYKYNIIGTHISISFFQIHSCTSVLFGHNYTMCGSFIKVSLFNTHIYIYTVQ